jgi:hypothetical protein
MNKAQKWVIGVAGAIVALMGIFPPWIEIFRGNGAIISQKLGSFALFDPPNATISNRSVEVDTQRLLIAWVVVVVIAAVCLLFAGKYSNRRQLRKCQFCAEMILAEAMLCRFCGRDVGSKIVIAGSQENTLSRGQVWIIPGTALKYHRLEACARSSTASFVKPILISELKAKHDGLQQCSRCMEGVER